MRQLDLVDACDPDAAARRRDLGIARAELGAGTPWTEDAAGYLRDYAASTYGQPFLIEDAAEVYPGPRPGNRRAWGAATLFAARRGWISKAGSAPARSSNLSLKHLWIAGSGP